MSVVAADIQALPSLEFATVADATINKYIVKAQGLTNATTWGTRYDEGVLYLSAHLLALDVAGSGAPSGPVTSESAGSMSHGFANGNEPGDSFYASTGYGRTYLSLRKLLRTQLLVI